MYMGLKGFVENPKIYDEVHVVSERELTNNEITVEAMTYIDSFPRSYHVEIVRIK